MTTSFLILLGLPAAYTVLTMVCLATGIPVVLCIVMVGVAGTVYTALVS